MARLVVDAKSLVVKLSAAEKLGAMRRDVAVPLAAIREVRTSTTPRAELRGLRAPGTGIPGLVSLCTRRGAGFRDFAAVYAGRQVVVVETSGAAFDRLVVSSANATDDVRRIRAAMPHLIRDGHLSQQ